MNRDDVVSVALDVLEHGGLEAFSMRRVAVALAVQPSALYWHVENKQTLLGLMAERIVAGVGVDADLIATSHRLRDAMMGVRDGAEVVATAAGFRFGLAELEADLAKQSSPDVAKTLLIFVIGHTQATQLHRFASAAGIIRPDPDLDASFDRGLTIILN
jgi:AcrR family transcriptional regulator